MERLAPTPTYVLQGEGDAGEIRIQLTPRDTPYVLYVGRAPDNDLTLRNRSVSGRHAHIEIGGKHDYHVTVRDHGADGTGSRFGTLVDETHLKGTAVRVNAGDAVCFGTSKYGAHFHLEDMHNPLPPGGLNNNIENQGAGFHHQEEFKDDLRKGGAARGGGTGGQPDDSNGPLFSRGGRARVPPSGIRHGVDDRDGGGGGGGPSQPQAQSFATLQDFRQQPPIDAYSQQQQHQQQQLPAGSMPNRGPEQRPESALVDDGRGDQGTRGRGGVLAHSGDSLDGGNGRGGSSYRNDGGNGRGGRGDNNDNNNRDRSLSPERSVASEMSTGSHGVRREQCPNGGYGEAEIERELVDLEGGGGNNNEGPMLRGQRPWSAQRQQHIQGQQLLNHHHHQQPSKPQQPGRAKPPHQTASPRVTLAYPTAGGYVQHDGGNGGDTVFEDRPRIDFDGEPIPASTTTLANTCGTTGGVGGNYGSGVGGRAGYGKMQHVQLPLRSGVGIGSGGNGNAVSDGGDMGLVDNGTGLTDFQWGVLQAERDAAMAHLKSIELGLAGVVAYSEVPLALTRPAETGNGGSGGAAGVGAGSQSRRIVQGGGVSRSNGSRGSLGSLRRESGGEGAGGPAQSSDEMVAELTARVEALDEELGVRSKQVAELLEKSSTAHAKALEAQVRVLSEQLGSKRGEVEGLRRGQKLLSDRVQDMAARTGRPARFGGGGAVASSYAGSSSGSPDGTAVGVETAAAAATAEAHKLAASRLLKSCLRGAVQRSLHRGFSQWAAGTLATRQATAAAASLIETQRTALERQAAELDMRKENELAALRKEFEARDAERATAATAEEEELRRLRSERQAQLANLVEAVSGVGDQGAARQDTQERERDRFEKKERELAAQMQQLMFRAHEGALARVRNTLANAVKRGLPRAFAKWKDQTVSGRAAARLKKIAADRFFKLVMRRIKGSKLGALVAWQRHTLAARAAAQEQNLVASFETERGGLFVGHRRVVAKAFVHVMVDVRNRWMRRKWLKWRRAAGHEMLKQNEKLAAEIEQRGAELSRTAEELDAERAARADRDQELEELEASLRGNQRKFDEVSGALEQAQAEKTLEAAQFASSHALSVGQLSATHDLNMQREREAREQIEKEAAQRQAELLERERALTREVEGLQEAALARERAAREEEERRGAAAVAAAAAAQRAEANWARQVEDLEAARRADLAAAEVTRVESVGRIQKDLAALIAEREAEEAAAAMRVATVATTQTDPNFMRYDALEARILARVEEQHEARMRETGFDGRGSQPGSGSPIREIGAYQARALNLEAQAEVTRHHMLAKITFLTLLRSLRRRQAHVLLAWRRVHDIGVRRDLSLKVLNHGLATMAARWASMRRRTAFSIWRCMAQEKMGMHFALHGSSPHAADAWEALRAEARAQIDREKGGETKALRGRIAELHRSLRQREDALSAVTRTYDWARVLVDQRRSIASLRGLLHEYAHASQHQNDVVAVLIAAGGGGGGSAVPALTADGGDAAAAAAVRAAGRDGTSMGASLFPQHIPQQVPGVMSNTAAADAMGSSSSSSSSAPPLAPFATATGPHAGSRPPESDGHQTLRQQQQLEGAEGASLDASYGAVGGGGMAMGMGKSGGTGGQPTRLGLQQYMAAKARETARAWREAQEWRRRLQASTHAWTKTVSVQGDLQKRITEERAASRRHAEQLLKMVTERDGHLATLQHELAAIARMDLPQAGGAGGGASVAFNNENASAASKASKRRQRAAETLRDHIARMQEQDRARATQLLDVMQGLNPAMVGYANAPSATAGRAATTRLPDDPSFGEDTVAGNAAAAAAMRHEVASLRARVSELQNQVVELEQQGGVRVVVETMELVESLQNELSRLQDSHTRLERDLSGALGDLAGAAISNHPTAKGT